MLAALLRWPQATFVSKLVIASGYATVTCEIDSGFETVALKLPALVTTDLRPIEPPYATLPNIIEAKKEPLYNIKLGKLDATGEWSGSRIRPRRPVPISAPMPRHRSPVRLPS